MKVNRTEEKALQEQFPWARTAQFEEYNSVLGFYQVQDCLEYAHGRSLLDMPCGDGLLTGLLARRFERVVGVDASSSHLRSARKRLPNAEFHESLIEDFQHAERFDTIVMLNVLEHVADPIEVLRHASTFLAPGGILIAHVPNAYAVNRRIAVLMGTLSQCEELSPFDIKVAGHRRSYSLASLRAEVEAAGLKIRATGGIFYKMLSTPQMDWFLKNGLWKDGGFGWGRIGGEERDWRAEFCRACYEFGRSRPEDCNVISVCATK